MKLQTLFACALLALASAAPTLQDKHQTTLEVLNNGHVSQDGKFAIVLQRVDDLSDDADPTNKVLAQKTQTVLIGFDVNLQGEIRANGVPVPLGLSNLQIEASTVKAEANSKYSEKQLEKAYDVGLVGMQVQAIAQKVQLPTGVRVTRLTLIEVITEMNGVAVQQTAAMQQIFEIDGSHVKAHPPCEGVMSKELQAARDAARYYHGHHYHHHRMLRKASAWLRMQPPHIRILVSLLTGTLFGLLVVLLVRLVTRVWAVLFGYSRVPNSDAAAAATVLPTTGSQKAKYLEVAPEETDGLPEYEEK